VSREGQAMCFFFCGANSILQGKLLTTPNPDVNEDMLKAFEMLGLNPQNLSQKYHNLKQLKPKISQYATS
jgi:biotin synthase